MFFFFLIDQAQQIQFVLVAFYSCCIPEFNQDAMLSALCIFHMKL